MKAQLLKSIFIYLLTSIFYLLKVNAQIVYTDVFPDITKNTNGAVYHLDLNNDTITDFDIAVQTGSAAGGVCGGTKPYARVVITPATGNFVATTSTSPTAIIFGAIIDSANTWSSGILPMARDYWVCAGGPKGQHHWVHSIVGQWLNATDKYLGLKFTKGGNTYYGWARLNVQVTSSASAAFTIKDYAYDSIPDQQITAGPTCTFPVSLTVNGSTTLCRNDSATLTVTGGSSWLWSTGETTSSIVVSPQSTFLYSVTVIDSSCIYPVNLTQLITSNNPVKTVSILNCDSIVSGANPLTTYQWIDCTNMLPITGATQKGLHPSVSGSYAVVVSLFGCVDTSVCNYIIPKNLSFIGNTSICKGDSVTLLASGGTSYTWGSGATTPGITVSPQISTIYFVTVYDSISNCSKVLTKQVIVNTPVKTVSIFNCDSIVSGAITPTTYQWLDCTNMLPIPGATQKGFRPSISGNYSVVVSLNGCVDTSACNYIVPKNLIVIGNASICNGDSVELLASGGTSYLWSTGATSPGIAISPQISTLYLVTVYDSISNCSRVFPKQVIVNTPVKTVSIANCDYLFSGATSPTTYQWIDCANMLPIPGATLNGFSPTTIGNYAVIVSLNGCVDTSVCNYIVPKTLSVIGNTTICKGDSVTLLASGGTSYLWSTGDTTALVTVAPINSTYYHVTVNDSATGCSVTINQQIIVNSINATISGTTSICTGNSTTLTVTGGTSYYWSTGNTTAGITVSPLTTVTYMVIVNDSVTGCSVTFNTQINVNSVNPSIIQSNDSLVAMGGDSTSTYQWIDCATNLPIAGATNSIFIPTTGGSYAVLINTGGCSVTSSCDTIIFQGIHQNNFQSQFNITPNPFNQSTVISWQLAKNENVSLKIFDLNGRLIATLADNAFHQGKHQIEFNAEKLEEGIYFLKIESASFSQTQKLVLVK